MNNTVITNAPPIMDLNMYYSINFKEAHPTLFAQNIIMQNNNVWFKSYDVDLTGYLPIMIYRLCINYTNALTSLNIKGQIKKFCDIKVIVITEDGILASLPEASLYRLQGIS